MKFIRDNIVTLLFVFIAVLLTLQIRGCKEKSDTTKQYKEKIDAVKQQQEQAVKDRNEVRAKYDSLLAIDRRRDTLLIQRYNTNTIKYEAIPVYINNLDRDSLRAAAIGQ